MGGGGRSLKPPPTKCTTPVPLEESTPVLLYPSEVPKLGYGRPGREGAAGAPGWAHSRLWPGGAPDPHLESAARAAVWYLATGASTASGDPVRRAREMVDH